MTKVVKSLAGMRSVPRMVRRIVVQQLGTSINRHRQLICTRLEVRSCFAGLPEVGPSPDK